MRYCKLKGARRVRSSLAQEALSPAQEAQRAQWRKMHDELKGARCVTTSQLSIVGAPSPIAEFSAPWLQYGVRKPMPGARNSATHPTVIQINLAIDIYQWQKGLERLRGQRFSTGYYKLPGTFGLRLQASIPPIHFLG
jgi:hypothetical protein